MFEAIIFDARDLGKTGDFGEESSLGSFKTFMEAQQAIEEYKQQLPMHVPYIWKTEIRESK